MNLRLIRLVPYASALTAALSPNLSAAQTQPNILIFVLDDFGNSKVSGYATDYAGYAAAATYLPETRTIDELAAAGLRFSRAWASPNCSPTRGSLQTGRQPYVHGIGSPLPPGGPTLQSPELDTNAHQMLADSFLAAGYATGYFGKWHLGVTDEAGITTPPPAAFTVRPHPALAGWERFVGTIDGDVDDYFDWGLVRWDEATLSGLSMNEVTHATTKTARAARNWIEQQEGPFLAFVSFHAPHSTNGTWDYDEVDPSMIRSPDILNCVNTPGLCDEERAAYAALVEHADIQIERTLAAMDPEVLANTLIFVLGDNGTPAAVQEGAFNVAGRSKGTAYETGIRIPLIVAHGNTYLNGGPGAITYPGTVIRAGVHVVDVYQTLHQYALGYNVVPSEGSDFTDCFSSNDLYCGRTPARYGYSETFQRDNTGAFTEGEAGVRYGHEKMVARWELGDTCVAAEFYDTFADPFETTQLSWPLGDVRGDRLRDYFEAQHATLNPGSWAYGLQVCE